MNEELFTGLLIGGMIILLIWGISRQQKQIQEAKQQLYKLVQQTGGQDIVIWRDDKWGQRGFIQFVLLYVDVNGIKHKHRVSRHLDLWGGLKDDFYWDKPLQLPAVPTEPTNSRAKEQIISEMDAEIKRLQEELRRAREEN